MHALISEPILGLVRFQAPVVVTERPTRTPVVNGTERPTRVPIVATERPTRVLPRPVRPCMLRPRRLGHLSGLHPAGRPRACCPALLAPFAVLSQVPVVVTERPTRGQQTRPPRAAATTVARAAATTAAMNAPPSRRAVGSRQPAAAKSGSTSKAGVPLETLLGASSANSAAKAAAAAQTRAGAPAATRTQAAAAEPARAALDLASPRTPARAALDPRLSGLWRLLRHGQLRLQRQPWLRARVAAAAATVAGAAEAAAVGGLRRQLRR